MCACVRGSVRVCACNILPLKDNVTLRSSCSIKCVCSVFESIDQLVVACVILSNSMLYA